VENDPANRWLREEIERVLASEPAPVRHKPASKHRRAVSTVTSRRRGT
jgi:hypothetical protein